MTTLSGTSEAPPGRHGDVLGVFYRWYAAHESGDASGLAAVLAADTEIHSLFRTEPIRGTEAAVAHFAGVRATFTDLAMDLTSAPATSTDRVLVEVMFHGAFTGELTWRGITSPGTGARFHVPGVAVIRVAAGRVRSVRTLFDRDEWLRQIGVDPCGGAWTER